MRKKDVTIVWHGQKVYFCGRRVADKSPSRLAYRGLRFTVKPRWLQFKAVDATFLLPIERFSREPFLRCISFSIWWQLRIRLLNRATSDGNRTKWKWEIDFVGATQNELTIDDDEWPTLKSEVQPCSAFELIRICKLKWKMWHESSLLKAWFTFVVSVMSWNLLRETSRNL